jgi:hypothetical protein
MVTSCQNEKCLEWAPYGEIIGDMGKGECVNVFYHIELRASKMFEMNLNYLSC